MRRRFLIGVQKEVKRHCIAIFRAYQVLNFRNTLIGADADVAARAVAAAGAATVRASTTIARNDNARAVADAAIRTTVRAANLTTDASITVDCDDVRAIANAHHAANATAEAVEAVAYGDNAVAGGLHINFSAALRADVAIARSDADRLLTRPLYPSGNAYQAMKLWQTLQRDLLSLDAGFEVWIDWYNDRLAGLPIQPELEREWALLPATVLERSPGEINAHLKNLRDAHSLTDSTTPGRKAP